MKLQDVSAPPSPAGPVPVRRGGFFSLLFEAEVETWSAGGLYRIEHPDFESSTLLISRVSIPGRGPEDAALFEAVFG